VGPLGVVLDPPALQQDLRFEELSKSWPFTYSSRSLPLNRSIEAFCQELPGSMKTVPVPLDRHQSLTA
jgi:hypothetical protein